MNNNKFASIRSKIFKGLALALGVAVLVLNILNEIETKTSLILLSLAIVSFGIDSLEAGKND